LRLLQLARAPALTGAVIPLPKFRLLALAAALAALPAVLHARQQQEEGEMQPIEAPQQLAPDALQLAQAAAARGDSAEALSRYLRILAATPDDMIALVGAGRAALDVGDTNAAAGFFSRADVLDPKNGQVKAGLAGTMLANGNSRAALRLFNEAVTLGVNQADIAADRGLAYDLRGAPKRAQADYGLALHTKPSDEVTRRLALSYAIAGDRVSALATLDPLLRKQDVPAWRDRVFVYALTGDLADAQHDAALVLPPDQVAELSPYLPRLAGLKQSDKAAAVHFGRFPGETPPEAKPVVVAAPRIQIDRATLAPPPVPAQTFAQVVAASQAASAPAAESQVSAAAQAKLDAKARAADKRRQAAESAAKAKREEEAEAREVARKNPARHWVQIAGGANKRDLGKEWDKQKSKWPSQLAGRTPWTMHYRFTNRLLIGPFASSSAAQDWVGDRKKEGFSTFRVETKAGDPVERVD
jgi:Flp pilus assembly protein TadD